MADELLVYLNGDYVPYSEAKIPVEDRSVEFGDAIYEVVRYYKGKPFRMDRHMARLKRSADGIWMPLPPLAQIEQAMNSLVDRQNLGDASVYLEITRGSSGARAHLIPDDPKPFIFAIARHVPVVRPRRSLTAVTVGDDRWARCYMKTTMLLPNTMALKQARQRGANEGIFVRDGFVMEATSSNVFFVFNGVLCTPPLTNYILPGITREVVLELAAQEGITVAQDPIPAASIYEATEAFLSGTVSEVSPIVEINRHKIGTGEPGPIHHRIATAYDRLIGV
jgi:D-alanine transaminase